MVDRSTKGVADYATRLLRQLRGRRAIAPSDLRPLISDPAYAVVAQRYGLGDRFLCPIGNVIMLNGLGFAPHGWHPFSAVLREKRSCTYRESVLSKFYERWQPADAAHAVAGFDAAPPILRQVPAHGYHYVPWSGQTLAAVLADIEAFHKADNAEHGNARLRLDQHGFKHHGPASDQLGEAELIRLYTVCTSLERHGYDRRHGDVNVYVLRNGSEMRFVCRGGVHRVAAMAALGESSIPAQLRAPFIVDRSEAHAWPQVVTGNWPLANALMYFDHLFTFDSRAWAKGLGLST